MRAFIYLLCNFCMLDTEVVVPKYLYDLISRSGASCDQPSVVFLWAQEVSNGME